MGIHLHQVRYTALGSDMEWKIQTDEDRRELEEVDALRWVGEQSPLAVSQAKVRDYQVSLLDPVEYLVVVSA